MKVTIIGHVCIDKNVSEHATYTSAGGPAIFIDRVFKQFPDSDVRIIAPYGKDFLPYVSDLTILPRVPQGDTTLVYENVTMDGIRKQKAYSRDGTNPIDLDSEVCTAIGSSDIVFFAPLLPNYPVSYVSSVRSHMKKDALLVLSPQGYFRSFDGNDDVIVREFIEAKELLKIVDIIILSEQDHPNMFATAHEWALHSHSLIIVTTGETGARAYHHEEEILLPTTKVLEENITDSVGAGDVFSAGFAYKYKSVEDIKEAGRFANALARVSLIQGWVKNRPI